MDEPLSALDEPTRERILWDISALKERFAIPMLYVTHNLREAYSLADRVVVIDQGKVIEKGARGGYSGASGALPDGPVRRHREPLRLPGPELRER